MPSTAMAMARCGVHSTARQHQWDDHHHHADMRRLVLPHTQCGCMCTQCCSTSNSTDCFAPSTRSLTICPDDYTCEKNDKSACGIQYSNSRQASFCAQTNPSIWPALFQVVGWYSLCVLCSTPGTCSQYTPTHDTYSIIQSHTHTPHTHTTHRSPECNTVPSHGTPQLPCSTQPPTSPLPTPLLLACLPPQHPPPARRLWLLGCWSLVRDCLGVNLLAVCFPSWGSI